MSRESFILVLQSTRMITQRVREMTFVREDEQVLSYEAGQFITLHLSWEGAELRRNYSIAAPPNKTVEFQIAVVFVEGGRATRLLFAMELGERIETTGPSGRFVLRDEPPTRYLLVATGTGVTPYRSMLPELACRIDDTGFTGQCWCWECAAPRRTAIRRRFPPICRAPSRLLFPGVLQSRNA